MRLKEEVKRCYSVTVSAGVKKRARVSIPSPVFIGGVFPVLFLLPLSCALLFILSPMSAWAAVPNAPSGLSATALSRTQIRIDWTDNSGDETRFYIERKTGVTGTYTQVTNVVTNVTTYTNTGLIQSTEYYYRVRAYNASGYSSYSNESSATTLPLNAPSALSVSSASYTTVTLNWADNSADESGFRIERKTGAGGTYALIATVGASVTSYANTGLTQGTEYYYRVRAYNGSYYSDYSNELRATTQVLPGPTGLTATSLSSTQIKLTWADNSSDETYFYIEQKTGAAGTYSVIATVEADVTTYSNTGLSVNTEYYYRVRAYNANGYSPYSNEVSAATLTFNAPSDLTAAAISSSQINLTWTDNSTEETYFYIERKTETTDAYAQIGSVEANVTTYSNSGLIQTTTYYYRVRAYNSIGYSAYSDEAIAATLAFNAPSNLIATPLSSTAIKLTWKDNTTDETSFFIERKTGASGAYTQIGSVGVNVMTYSSTNLQPDKDYYYRVRAYNGGGYSSYSNEVSAITPGCTQEGYYQP